MSVSQIIVNAQMSNYDDMALAGIGAKLEQRFKAIMSFSLLFALGLSAVMTGLCYLLRGQIVGAFLTGPDAFDYAAQFTNILLTTSSLFGVSFVLNNALQAMGAARQALIANLSRQGIVYIPALFILRSMFGVTGLVWAQPVADLLSTALVAVLYLRTSRRLMALSAGRGEKDPGAKRPS